MREKTIRPVTHDYQYFIAATTTKTVEFYFLTNPIGDKEYDPHIRITTKIKQENRTNYECVELKNIVSITLLNNYLCMAITEEQIFEYLESLCIEE